MPLRRSLAAAFQRFVHWLEEKPDFPTLMDKVDGAVASNYGNALFDAQLQESNSLGENDVNAAVGREAQPTPTTKPSVVGNSRDSRERPASNIEVIGKRPRATKRNSVPKGRR